MPVVAGPMAPPPMAVARLVARAQPPMGARITRRVRMVVAPGASPPVPYKAGATPPVAAPGPW